MSTAITQTELAGVECVARGKVRDVYSVGADLLIVTVPLTTWGTNSTGMFDASGNFSATLPISSSNPHLFYLIKAP